MEGRAGVTNLTIDSINKIPIIAMMEHSPIPFGIKDNQSKIVYLNKVSLKFYDLPIGFDFEGRTDDEFPTPCAEFAQEFQAQDRKAECSENGAEIIITSKFEGKDYLEPYYSPKFPIYNNEGEVLGTLFYQKNSVSYQYANSLII